MIKQLSIKKQLGFLFLAIAFAVTGCATKPENVGEALIVSAAKLDLADSIVFDLMNQGVITEGRAQDLHLKVLEGFDLLEASNQGYAKYYELKQEQEDRCSNPDVQDTTRCNVIGGEIGDALQQGYNKVELAQGIFIAIVEALPSKYRQEFK